MDLGTAATHDHCLGKTTEPSVGSELPQAPHTPQGLLSLDQEGRKGPSSLSPQLFVWKKISA